MRREGIVGHRPRKRRALTTPDETAAAPDLLGWLFDPDHPDVAWCGDITYIPTDEGWLYVASTIDLASRHLLDADVRWRRERPWSAAGLRWTTWPGWAFS